MHVSVERIRRKASERKLRSPSSERPFPFGARHEMRKAEYFTGAGVCSRDYDYPRLFKSVNTHIAQITDTNAQNVEMSHPQA